MSDHAKIAEALRIIATGVLRLADAIAPTAPLARTRQQGRYYRIFAEPKRGNGHKPGYRQISEVWAYDETQAIAKEARHVTECGLPWNLKTMRAEPK